MLGLRVPNPIPSLAHGRIPSLGTSLAHGRRLRWRVYAGSFQGPQFDEFTRRALSEAVAIYQDAVQQSEQQTRSELLQSFQTETPAAAETSPPATSAALSAFWSEQGLKGWQVERLVKELQQDPATARLSINALSSKVTSLQRILPAADVAEMVFQQYGILQLTAAQVVQTMVHLVQGLPGRDAGDMVRRQPKLLLLDDLTERLPKVLAKLKQLHPSRSQHVVEGIIEEHPDLLLRMPYYTEATLLDELPIELQNMMVLADQGLGFLYRYYKTNGQGAAGDIGLDEELET